MNPSVEGDPGQIAAILPICAPVLGGEAGCEIAIVMVQLMKASRSLTGEEGLPGRAAGLRELQAPAVQYLKRWLLSVSNRNRYCQLERYVVLKSPTGSPYGAGGVSVC